MKAHPSGWFLNLLFVAFVIALLIGCQSTPKVNWDSRIGQYTYDQAVVEFGVPDKTATLSDGRKVVEWITRRSGGSAFSLGVGSFGRHTGVGVSQDRRHGWPDTRLAPDVRCKWHSRCLGKELRPARHLPAFASSTELDSRLVCGQN